MYKVILFSGTDPHKECYIYISKNFHTLIEKVLNEFESKLIPLENIKECEAPEEYKKEEEKRISFTKYKEEYLKDVEDSKDSNKPLLRFWADGEYKNDYCPHIQLVEETTMSSYNWKIYFVESTDSEYSEDSEEVISTTIFEH